ncbi:MAG: hypothetical protein JNJ44_04455 [Zoogloeaceae bacterium]|nr:hypothetical protein [Zoogloeaceae bacterium]
MLKQVWRAMTSLRWWGLFFLCGLFFMLFGLASYNLFALVKANFSLLVEYGWMAAQDGGLQQFFELLGLSYLSLLFWVLFKYCETLLVRELTPAPSASAAPISPPGAPSRPR